MENSIFKKETTAEVIQRINKLSANSKPEWGVMSVDQMLAHCNKPYEATYGDSHKKPNFFVGTILKLFVKKIVTSDIPYKQNNQTNPSFVVNDKRDFEQEKAALIDNITKTQAMGEVEFQNREYVYFGKLSIKEWNNLFYKHLDHHLTQFGV